MNIHEVIEDITLTLVASGYIPGEWTAEEVANVIAPDILKLMQRADRMREVCERYDQIASFAVRAGNLVPEVRDELREALRVALDESACEWDAPHDPEHRFCLTHDCWAGARMPEQSENYFEDLAVAWVTYRKEYGPTDITTAHKAFLAGWEAAYGLAGDEGPMR